MNDALTYTPTTHEVRIRYSVYRNNNSIPLREEFDRWLTEHDRAVAAAALSSAADEFHNGHQADKPREDYRRTVPQWLLARANSLSRPESVSNQSDQGEKS